jgi:SPP1 family predicted phage head-tail adaptor
MRAGDLRHRITFQTRSTGQDAIGGQALPWSDVTTVWADVSPLSGREIMAAQAIQSELTHMISVRYQSQFSDPKVMAAMRIMYGNRIFNIHASIDVDERHKTIEISCGEGLNDG